MLLSEPVRKRLVDWDAGLRAGRRQLPAEAGKHVGDQRFAEVVGAPQRDQRGVPRRVDRHEVRRLATGNEYTDRHRTSARSRPSRSGCARWEAPSLILVVHRLVDDAVVLLHRPAPLDVDLSASRRRASRPADGPARVTMRRRPARRCRRRRTPSRAAPAAVLPAAGRRSGDRAGVRLKRGAGAGCTTPSHRGEGLPGDVVRVLGRFAWREHRRHARLGVLEHGAPLVPRAGPERGGEQLLHRTPARGIPRRRRHRLVEPEARSSAVRRAWSSRSTETYRPSAVS